MAPAALPTDPPLSPALLERLVLEWRRTTPTTGGGAHLRRRQGHSLEFREYRLWQRGDDIRTVDWRASARQPRRGDLLMRSFEAEESLTLAIVIDNRPSMSLPEAMPRLLWALWAARALATLALDKGDVVILARLCTGAAEPILELRGQGAQARLRAWTETVWHQRAVAGDSFADLETIARMMRPAGASVLISDMLFEDGEGRMRRFAQRMQRRKQSFSIVQLDSFAHELALLHQAQIFHLVRPSQTTGDDMHLYDETVMGQAREAVHAHLQSMRQDLQGGGLDWPTQRVSWPLPKPSGAKAHLGPPNRPAGLRGRRRPDPAEDPGLEQLKHLFTQSFPRLSLIAGLALGGGRR